MTDAEFDKIYYSKRSVEILIESLFHPERHKALNEYIERKSQEWRSMMMELNRCRMANLKSSPSGSAAPTAETAQP